MYHPIFIFIGLRYLWNPHLPKFKKFIIFLSILIVSVSIAFLIIITSIINGVEENFKKNILSFIPHLIITNKDKYVDKSKFPKKIFKLHNIEKVSDFIKKDVVVRSKNNMTLAEVIGVNITNDENIRNYNIKNVLDILRPGKYNAIIGKELCKKLHVKIGNKITLFFLLNKISSLTGKNIKEHTFKIVDTFFTKNEVDYYQILINQKDSRNFLNYSKNYITGWRIWLKKPLSLDLYKIKKLITPFIILDWQSEKGQLFKAMKIEEYMIFFLFFLFLLVSTLNFFITFVICTIERKNTIAILKLQGLLDWKIILIFVIVGGSTAIISSILGTAISILLVIENNFLQSLVHFFFNTVSIPIFIIPSQIFFINVASILLAILSSLYPSWCAIKSKPSRILYNE